MDIISIVLAAINLLLLIVIYLYYTRSAAAQERLRGEISELSAAKAKVDELSVVHKSELFHTKEKLQEVSHEKEKFENIAAARETEIRALLQESANYRSQVENIQEQLANLEANDKRQREQFKNIATEIFSEHTKEFKSTNKESIDLLLKPFKDNITEFRDRVEKIYSIENQQRGALSNELRNLMELNRKITTETTNLTNALKGNSKIQGDWGEMILETILDSSNLEKGIHYSTQYNIKDEAGNNLRPDVVLNLPDNKQIVIDSKTSLTAFVSYVAAESEAERAILLDQHLKSVRQHVNELGRKEYQKLVNSPDFVIMFIPNEPAFLAALQADNTIWGDAYNKKVIISSPTNLFALLKLVDDLWKRNAQSKNTEAIVKNATKLFEQLVNFSSSLEDIGKALETAQTKYDDAFKRLHTGNDNISRLGLKLRKLGLPTKKQLSSKMVEGNEEESETEE
ncbi:MAG: DNA recombination protein RmuC [Rikenellaceae bacterium]